MSGEGERLEGEKKKVEAKAKVERRREKLVIGWGVEVRGGKMVEDGGRRGELEEGRLVIS